MRVAFICASPYQIFNAINLMLNNNYIKEEVDIYILNNFEKNKVYEDKLRESDIFNKVYTVDTDIVSNSIFGIWNLRYAILTRNLKLYIKNKIDKYDIIWLSSWDVFTYSLVYKQKKENKKLKVNLFEDGIATYLNKNQVEPTSKIQKIMKVNYKKLIDELFMYRPELGIYNKCYKKISAIDIPNEENFKIIREIFNYKETHEKTYYKKIIYLDQPIEEVDWKFGRKDIIEKILEYIDFNNISVKRHPRNQNFNYLKYKVDIIPNFEIPWEVVGKDIKNKVLISFNSTAALTPKFIYDNNNKIVLLYKYFLKNDDICEKWDEFFYNIQKIYPKNLFIPKNEVELKVILAEVTDMVV